MGRATGRRVMGRIGGTVRNLSRGGVLLAAGVLGLAVVLADAGLAFAAVPSWSVVSSANASSESSSTTQSNLFHRVSCSSSSTCIATGRYGVRQTLAGGYSVNSSGFGSWSQVLPSDELGKNSSYVDNSLHATSCSSSSNCWSVGYYYDTSLSSYQVFAWNSNSSGSKTNQVLDSFGNEPSGDGFFYGVSCVYSVDFCPAVGYYMDSSGVAQTLIGYPSATSPVIGSSPNAGSGNNYLYGVSCTSTSFCAAVGYYIDSAGVAQTLADTYDGSAWTASASTNTSSSQTNYLYGVSCVSASFCASAGYWSQDPLTLSSATMAEIYNGSSWSSPSGLSSSSQPVNGNRLFGVACVSSSSCLTVGRYSVAFSLAESYTPTSWSLSPAQITTQSDLYGISCKSSTFCVAVGDYYDSSNVQQMLIETYNGTSWSEVTGLSNPANSAGENALDGVSCASSTSCVAVGSYLESTSSGTQTQTLAVVYNGSSWTTVTPANQGSYGDTLFDISCTTSTSCVAVGMYFASLSPPTESVLTEYYNGSSWSSNSPTSPSTAGSMLMGISCASSASSTSCEAVGNYVDSSGVEQALVEAYNGSSWSEQTSVDSGSGQNALTDVSCVSSNFCMATGEYAADTITGVTGTLTEEYNGSSWSIVSSPDVGSGNNVLYGVSCASSTSCSGLGYEANSSAFTTNFSSATQIPQTLAEEWS